MTTTFDLSTLSFESSEFDYETAPTDDIVTEPDNPTYSKPYEDMMTVGGIWQGITTRRYVCRDDMEQVKKLSNVYPAFESLLKKYPVNSFSKEPSRINYDISTEGVMRTAYEAVMKALRDVIDFIADSLRSMWAFLTSTGQKTSAVDGLADKLKACQTYIVEVDRIMATTSKADDFRKVREGAFNNEFHNLSGKWNVFKNMQLSKSTELHSDADILGGVVKTQLTPFVLMIDKFLNLIGSAKTEDEVMMSIDLIKTYRIDNSKLLKLARDYGYNPANQIGPNMTDFQAQAGVVRNQYKSWINDRSSMERAQFNGLMASYVIEPMAEDIAKTIDWAKSQIEPVVKRIKEFSGKNMNPGLEEVYLKNLTPFLKVLTSTLSGFTTIEHCIGFLADNRNNVSGNIYNATVGIVKKIDAYLAANKNNFTIAEQNVLWRQRKTLHGIVS